MAGDIIELTKSIMDLFTKNDLSRVQSIFVLKSVEMQIQENITRDIIQDTKKGPVDIPGVG